MTLLLDEGGDDSHNAADRSSAEAVTGRSSASLPALRKPPHGSMNHSCLDLTATLMNKQGISGTNQILHSNSIRHVAETTRPARISQALSLFSSELSFRKEGPFSAHR